MNKEFYAGNRKSLYQKLEAGSLVVVFSGHAPIKTNDENYPFFTNRNFLYLTGIEQENIVLMAYVGEGTIEETLYILPPDRSCSCLSGLSPRPKGFAIYA